MLIKSRFENSRYSYGYEFKDDKGECFTKEDELLEKIALLKYLEIYLRTENETETFMCKILENKSISFKYFTTPLRDEGFIEIEFYLPNGISRHLGFAEADEGNLEDSMSILCFYDVKKLLFKKCLLSPYIFPFGSENINYINIMINSLINRFSPNELKKITIKDKSEKKYSFLSNEVIIDLDEYKHSLSIIKNSYLWGRKTLKANISSVLDAYLLNDKEDIKSKMDTYTNNLSFNIEAYKKMSKELRELLNKKTKETELQKFFVKNRVLISQLLGYPAGLSLKEVKVKAEKSMKKNNLDVVNYLKKRQRLSIIEFKNHNFKLLSKSKKTYRNNIKAISSQVASAVQQCSFYKTLLIQNLVDTKSNKNLLNITQGSVFHIDCFVIIGRDSCLQDKISIDSFNAYKSACTIQIKTYDEILDLMEETITMLNSL